MKKIYTFCLFLVLSLFSLSNLNAQWAQCNGPFGGTVSKIFVFGNDIYVSIDGIAIYKSTNNGELWKEMDLGITKDNINTMFGNDSVLYVANYNQIVSSTDGGQTWEKVYFDFGIIPNNNIYIYQNELYFPKSFGGIYKSNDFGKHWTYIESKIWFNNFIYIDSVLICASSGGIMRSLDAGMTWTKTDNTDLNSLTVLTFYKIDNVLFAYSSNYL